MSWGEINKNSNIISLYHFNGSDLDNISDEMLNYDMENPFATQNTSLGRSGSRKGNCLQTNHQAINNNNVDGYLTRTKSRLNYHDYEGIRTIAFWMYTGYYSNVYESYRQVLVSFSNSGDQSCLKIFKKATWNTNTEEIEDTFSIGCSIDISRYDEDYSQETVITDGVSSSQSIEFRKSHFVVLIFKPSTSALADDGYIDLYVDWVRVAHKVDALGDRFWWRGLASESEDKRLNVGCPSDENLNGSTSSLIFNGKIDDLCISENIWTKQFLMKLYNNWRSSQII